jgi:hypothetical protein
MIASDRRQARQLMNSVKGLIAFGEWRSVRYPQIRPAPRARAGVDRKTLGPLEHTKYSGAK